LFRAHYPNYQFEDLLVRFLRRELWCTKSNY